VENLEPTKPNSESPRLIKDIWDAILNDDWMWIVVWGKPRTGKSTVQMQAGFAVLHDWDQVLQAFVYNLAGILYKMDNGIPCRIMTRNKLHNRIPIMLADDFGAQGNKAKTQHEPAWDLFKGTFDTLGTKMAVLMASMGTPTAMTQQIQEKYTHEVYVETKGVAKYDKVDWQQNYGGWQPKQNKDWIETFDFYKVPDDVYKEYDGMRMSLVDELEQLIKDCMAESETLSIIKRMKEIDFDYLEILRTRGSVSWDWMHLAENARYQNSLMRCKSHSLALADRRQSHYWYAITDLGIEVLDTYLTSKQEPKSKLEPIAPEPKIL